MPKQSTDLEFAETFRDDLMRVACPNKAENEKDCPCPETDCPRHGICCECIRYQKQQAVAKTRMFEISLFFTIICMNLYSHLLYLG